MLGYGGGEESLLIVSYTNLNPNFMKFATSVIWRNRVRYGFEFSKWGEEGMTSYDTLLPPLAYFHVNNFKIFIFLWVYFAIMKLGGWIRWVNEIEFRDFEVLLFRCVISYNNLKFFIWVPTKFHKTFNDQWFPSSFIMILADAFSCYVLMLRSWNLTEM